MNTVQEKLDAVVNKQLETTGVVRVIDFAAAHDSGVILNRMGADGQVYGGVLMGIGQALTEATWFDADGRQAYRQATEDEQAQMFAEDLALARDIQAAWGEASIMKGDVMAEDVKKIAFIPSYCKTAARYYGRDRKWLYALKDGDMKKCPFCTTTIAVEAIKCPNCSEVVDQARYKVLKAGAPLPPPIQPAVGARP